MLIPGPRRQGGWLSRSGEQAGALPCQLAHQVSPMLVVRGDSPGEIPTQSPPLRRLPLPEGPSPVLDLGWFFLPPGSKLSEHKLPEHHAGRRAKHHAWWLKNPLP